MKLKRTVFLTAVVVAMGLLLGTGAAQAATLIFHPDNPPSQAIGINGLEIGANIYEVHWVFESSLGAYGSPQKSPFNNEDKAREAAEAINAVLNEAGGITGVGEPTTTDDTDFRRIYVIGYNKFTGSLDPGGPSIEITRYWESATDTSGSGVWVSLFEAQADSRDTRPYAIFIDVGDTGTGNQAPQADAGGPYEGEVGVPVQFDGSNSTDPDGIIVNRDWNFGDDSPVANGETPSHTYTEPGLYNVTHYVGDSSGATDADSTLVRITSPLCECDLNTDGTCTVLTKILVEDGIAAASRSTRRQKSDDRSQTTKERR